jgi:hypothetical protein
MSIISSVSELDLATSDSGDESSAVEATHLHLVKAPSSITPKAERVGRERRAGGYDPQLEWLILSGDAALGARGTLAGVVSQIERGSVGGTGNLDGGGCYKHPYTDLQIGQGTDGIGEVELHRHLSAAWALLRPATRARLSRRYSAPRAEYRSDHGFGAKDRYVEGSDGRSGQHSPTRTGTTDPLGEYAGLAFELCDNPGLLLIACVEPSPVKNKKINKAEQARRAAVVKEALRRAHAADTADHAEWFAAKAQVPALRTMRDRTGRDRSQVTIGQVQVGRAARSGRALRVSRMSEAAFREAMERGMAAATAAAAE